MNCPECAKYKLLLKVSTYLEYRITHLVYQYNHRVEAHGEERCETCERELRLMREYVNFSDETRYRQVEAELLEHQNLDHTRPGAQTYGVGIAAGLFPGREVRITS